MTGFSLGGVRAVGHYELFLVKVSKIIYYEENTKTQNS